MRDDAIHFKFLGVISKEMRAGRNYFKGLVILIFLFMPFLAHAEELSDGTKAEETLSAKGTDTGNEAAEEEFVEAEIIADPLEPWNRIVFSFNDRLYFWLIKPLAQGYNVVVPEWGRVRVRNIFQNITMPVRFVNSLLQLKIKTAGIELARFLMNSTLGLGGMFDVAAQNPDLKGSDEDLDQTLGVYGIGDGLFIVWPVLGPSSLRDSAGLVGDSFLNPVNYLTPIEAVFAVRSYEYVNATSLEIGEYEDLKESAVDPYISVRDAYTEHRRSKVKE